LFEYLAPDQWGPRVGDLEADYVVLGHTHLQGLRTFGKLTVVNPGSVGLARDGQAEACYAIHEDDRIHLKRIPYDVVSTAACLRAAPLPEEVTQGLLRVLIGPEEANSQKPGGTP
jgi:diadenosine tetraphosphatase ApaH/serine/threonine PP2A family protein phosphatase